MSAAATISVDEFMALEQKVLQTVELIKTERTARAEAETARSKAETARTAAEAERDAAITEAAELRQKLSALDEKLTAAGSAEIEVANLQREREAVSASAWRRCSQPWMRFCNMARFALNQIF